MSVILDNSLRQLTLTTKTACHGLIYVNFVDRCEVKHDKQSRDKKTNLTAKQDFDFRPSSGHSRDSNEQITIKTSHV